MTADNPKFDGRMVSSAAAVVIALACGTNYVYSAWAPQFADRLHLSATESELIGLAGNLGMYTMGVPIGMFIDSRGPRPAVLLGAALLGLGYLPLERAYNAGQGSLFWLSFASYLTGLGGCMAFAASVKTSALNWPHHRGTATAFPLAAFGLSAFFFSFLSAVLFPGSPGKFLLLLSLGTFGMVFVGFFFLHVMPHGSVYQPLPADSGIEDSQDLCQSLSSHSRSTQDPSETGTLHEYATATTSNAARHSQHLDRVEPTDDELMVSDAVNLTGNSLDEDGERRSLISQRAAASTLPNDTAMRSSIDLDRSHRIDIRGWDLLKSFEFWQLFTIIAILAGIGLMTINNIGNDAAALWKHYDPSIDNESLVLHQQLHVSILSLGSFAGRLLSGVGSDFLVRILHASRIWCLALACVVFSLAQICALTVVNPHLLGFVSGFSGLGYGFMYGVFPSIVAESFGIRGLSQNWGFMTLAPVISGNIFNLFYGLVLDAHSVIEDDGTRRCEEGIECYRSAYIVTLSACGAGLLVTLWVIWHQARMRLRESSK